MNVVDENTDANSSNTDKDTSSPSAIDTHIHNLSNVCRICTNSLLSGNKYFVKDFLEPILLIFLVDCSSDKKEEHPANICRCRAAIGHKIKRGSSTILPVNTWLPVIIIVICA